MIVKWLQDSLNLEFDGVLWKKFHANLASECQGGRRSGRWGRQFALSYHKCSKSKRGRNFNAHPSR